MAVGFGEELYASGLVELLEEFDDLWRVVLKELDGASADGESHLELFAVHFSHLDECLDGRNIRAFGSFGDAAFVLVVVEIIVILADLKEAVTLEMYVLVDLEIKTDSLHIV